ncbi:MAG: hypothetical protein MUE83_13510 [Tabrizicola sp.]|jgi:hypothetical protein|nr:hypothetical protein [Tabrizicola sp.]
MKRNALLAITGCTAKAFETYAHRDFLPFHIPDGGRWSDYTIDQAFELKVLSLASEATDNKSAAYLAERCLNKLHPIDPFAFNGGDLWVALVRYEWADAPENWIKLGVVAGRACDLPALANEHVAGQAPEAKLTSILAIPAHKIALDLLSEAREWGLPEGQARAVPEDLTGFPEWFKEIELQRRAIVFGTESEA